MTKPQTIQVIRTVDVSRCKQCRWDHWAKKLKVARQAAHRHIEETGHSVDVTTINVFTYGVNP